MQIHPRAPAWALALSFAVPAPALCADGVIPTIEVAGVRYDQRREETASTVVVGRDELLRQGDRTLADALKRVAGVTIGGGGRATDIRLRGLGDGYTQLLLNGVAAPNGFSLESLAPELIERVEIARTASAQFGAQAIAGTINIVLRKASAAAAATVKLGLDQQRGAASGSVSAEAGGKGEDASYAVPVTLSRTRQGTLQLAEEAVDEAVEEAVHEPSLQAQAAQHRVSRQAEMNAATNLAIAPRASWRIGQGPGADKLDLRSLVNVNRRAIGMTASEAALAGDTSRYPLRGSLFTSTSVALRMDALWTRKLDDGAQIDAKAGVEGVDRDADFAFSRTVGGVRGPGLHFVRSDSRDSGYYAGATYTAAPRAGHTLTAGWDGARSRRRQLRLGRELDGPDGAVTQRDDNYRGGIDRIGAFIQDAWEVRPSWSLSLGWRWEAMNTTVDGVQGATVSQRSVVASPLLQALYKAGGGAQLRAGLTRTYKAPTMANLIPRRYAVDNNNSATNPDNEGNPALRPEKAWGLDLGYDLYAGKDTLFAVSGYLRRIEDVTVARLFLDGAVWVTAPDNQGRALARGLALEARFPVPGLPLWGVSANAARNWSRVERIAGPDNRLDAQAPLSANAGIEYRGKFRAGANLTYTRGAVTRMSAMWTTWEGGTRALDVYALWGTGSKMRVRLAATNLLERDQVAGSRYAGAQGTRRTVIGTSNGAALKLTFELDL